MRFKPLREHHDDILLDEILARGEAEGFKVTTEIIRDHFIERGRLPATPEAILLWQTEETNRIVQQRRAYRRRKKRTNEEPVNLWKRDEGDAAKVHYWRKFGDLIDTEHLQHIQTRVEAIVGDVVLLYDYFDKACALVGPRFKQMVWFDMPPRPQPLGETG